jgi:hypothetical protein
VWLKKRYPALFIIHLESPNFTPIAMLGAFSDATGRIG